MKTLLYVMCIVLLATLVVGAQGPARADQDKTAVRQAAYDYAEGFYEGAADRMERGVHPAIVKRGLMPTPDMGLIFAPMNAETLVEVTRMGGAKSVPADQRDIAFELLDIRDNVASARIFTSRFNDYLHLVKQDDRWRIVNVLWQPPSPAGVANKEADKAAVAKILTDFAEGLSAADAVRLERVIHPEAVLRVFRPNNVTGKYFLQDSNRDSALAQARARKMPPFADAAVTVLHVYDNLASALMTTGSLTLYGHLARQNDQWRVVNVLLR